MLYNEIRQNLEEHELAHQFFQMAGAQSRKGERSKVQDKPMDLDGT